jgi:hydroxyacyl-ACP dehydratase HTD2-like protein with hotdog domain
VTITWLKGDLNFTKPMVIDEKANNVVIVGEWNSKDDVTLKVKNLIVVGNIISEKKLSIETEKDLFYFGIIRSKEKNIVAGEGCYNKINEEVIQKIKNLGINIFYDSSGLLKMQTPF